MNSYDYVTSYSYSNTGGYAVWKSGKIEQWGWVEYPTGAGQNASNVINLFKPYTSGYSVVMGLYNVNSGWGKYELDGYSLSAFNWRITSSSGNYNLSARRFNWYTIGK